MAHTYPQGYFGKKPVSQKVHLETLSPYKRHLCTFTEALPHGASVLDLGCGAGKTLRLIRELRPDLVLYGCDISDVAAYVPPDVPFTQCSAEEMSVHYKEHQFDAVVCQHVIEHLTTPVGLMESLRKVLKPKGALFIETPNWTRLFTPFAHSFFWNDYTHVRIYPKFALVKLLQEYSFTVNRVITCSTAEWFPKKVNTPSTSTTTRTQPYTWNSLGARIFAKIANPLIRDVLIVVAHREL